MGISGLLRCNDCPSRRHCDCHSRCVEPDVGAHERAVAVSGLGAGTLALLAFAATRGSASLHSAPVWAYVGGACGFVLLLGITLAVPRIGALSTAALVVAAQLAMAAAIDQFGWLGVSTRSLSATRLFALVGMLFFAWLSVRR